MDHPNAEVVRRGFAAFGRADLETIQNIFADHVIYHVGGKSPLAGEYRGKDSVLGLLGDVISLTGGTYKAELHDALGNDEHAVALVRETGEREGRRLDQNSVHVFHIAGGKVTEAWLYPGDRYTDDEFWS